MALIRELPGASEPVCAQIASLSTNPALGLASQHHRPRTVSRVTDDCSDAAAAGSAGVLAVLTDPELRDELDRVAAAVGVRVVHAGGGYAVSRKTWSAAAAVVLDQAAADRCGQTALPRRAHVSVLTAAEANDGDLGGGHHRRCPACVEDARTRA